jgi:hypothetical protein
MRSPNGAFVWKALVLPGSERLLCAAQFRPATSAESRPGAVRRRRQSHQLCCKADLLGHAIPRAGSPADRTRLERENEVYPPENYSAAPGRFSATHIMLAEMVLWEIITVKSLSHLRRRLPGLQGRKPLVRTSVTRSTFVIHKRRSRARGAGARGFQDRRILGAIPRSV